MIPLIEAIVLGGSITLSFQGYSYTGSIDEMTTLILFIIASSAIENMLSVIIFTVAGPVLPAISFVPARIMITSGLRSIASGLNLTSI